MKTIWALAFLLIFHSYEAAAQETLTESQVLSFGEMAISGTTVQSIVIATDGDSTVTPNPPGTLIELLPGQNGIYQLSGFDPNLAVSADVVDTLLTRIGGSPSFDITNFTFDPGPGGWMTDGAGSMTLDIGATLSTQSGETYTPGGYRGTYTLIVSY